MTFVRSWIRLELPRRWRSLAVLTLIIAAASGTVMAAAAGARRGASTLERLQDRTRPATAAVYTNTAPFDWSAIRKLPEVEALSTFLLDYTYAYEGLPEDIGGFPPSDPDYMVTTERPVIFDGRMTDPTRADEVVVTRGFVKQHHKGVGDTVVLDLPTPDELAAEEGSGPNGSYTGPHLTMTIVGVILSPWFTDEPGRSGLIQMSPGVVAKYPANTRGPADNPENLFNYESALVRLRGGVSALPAFRRDAARVTGRTDLEIVDLPGGLRAAQREISCEARCMLAFGLAALVASLFLVGQAVARYAAGTGTELGALRAIGMSPRQSIVACAAAPAIVGLAGASLGVLGAYLASRLFPFGTADILEPNHGLSTDWVVFGGGAALVVALVVAGGAAAAAFGLAAERRERSARRSTVATAGARAGLPVPVVVGTRFALEPGRGANAVPVRPALVGAVAGVLGVVAAFTFSRGVSEAVAHPQRFGQQAQLQGFIGVNGQDFLPSDALKSVLGSSSAVVGVNDARQGIATGARVNASYVLYTYSGGAKPLPVVLMSGRMPRAASEIVLAPRTFDDLHASVGDKVRFAGDRGTAAFTVTGSGLLPEGPRNSYAEGGWITDEGYDVIFTPTNFKFHIIEVALPDGADIEATNAALSATIGRAIPEAAGYSLGRPDPPVEVAEIRQVRVLPIVLGCFLGLLAIAAIGHALALAVRRRAAELAVLRALGMTQWQSRSTVVTQASVLAGIGLVLGLPLGVALGRSVWRLVADFTPMQYVPPTAVWAMVIAVPAALVAANVLAAIPGRRAARMKVALVLRAE